MAQRIGEYILRGELRNDRPNSVYGWLQFSADCGVHIELTGNLGGELQGKHLRFSTAEGAQEDNLPESELPSWVIDLADRQIGVVGEGQLRLLRVPTIPQADYEQLAPGEQLQHSVEKECLYLEWHSQNGHLEAAIVDPIIHVVDPDGDESHASDPGPLTNGLDSGLATAYLDASRDLLSGLEEGLDDEEDEEEDDDEDPYGLFDANLQRDVYQALEGDPNFVDPLDPEAEIDPDQPGGEPGAGGQRPSWDEVLPGIDPETKAMYEQWDEIFEGEKDEPVGHLFQTPLRLPPPDRVTSQEEAQELVVSILAQLALLSVAVDVCEHYTPLDTYQLLMTEILPTARVHPNLAASRMVQHYATSDYCPKCAAEFEGEFEGEDLGPGSPPPG